MKRQAGSTALGFIIGVVVGLALALGVAVYVTKVPIPFLHQGPSRSADQDADELRKNKDWDPNAPLYGKNPARPASAPAPSLAASAAPVAAPVAAPAVASVKAVPVTPTATASAPKALAASSPAADTSTFYVHAGAFLTVENAEAQRVKLSLTGVEAKITEREQSGRNVYRVRVGPIDGKEEADKIKERLDAAGFETQLIRVQR